MCQTSMGLSISGFVGSVTNALQFPIQRYRFRLHFYFPAGCYSYSTAILKDFVSEWHRDHSLLLVLSIYHCRTFFMHCVNEFLDEDWAFVSTEALTQIGD